MKVIKEAYNNALSMAATPVIRTSTLAMLASQVFSTPALANMPPAQDHQHPQSVITRNLGDLLFIPDRLALLRGQLRDRPTPW